MQNIEITPEVAHASDVLMKDVLLAKKGEEVLITADDATDMAAVLALKDAAHKIGAKATVTLTPQMPHQGGFSDPFIPEPVRLAIKSCDVWVELGFPYMMGSKASDAALHDGRVRYYLSPGLTSESMVRLYTGVDLDALYATTHEFEKLLGDAAGKECRITNDAGSDVTFKIDEPQPIALCRAEKPGITGVPGTVLIPPDIETVKGVLKLESVFTDDIYDQCKEPLTIELDGKIQKISGGGEYHDVWENALKKAGGGKDYGYVIHFTCGFHPGAQNTGDCFIEDQRAAGNNAVGLGLPFWVEGGGETHPDSMISGQSVWVDGEQFVENGTIIAPPELRELATKLGAAPA